LQSLYDDSRNSTSESKDYLHVPKAFLQTKERFPHPHRKSGTLNSAFRMKPFPICKRGGTDELKMFFFLMENLGSFHSHA
jgi:hypothetical protein